MTVQITKRVTYELTRIYFDGIVQLAFARREVVGFQCWKSAGVFTLELTFRDGAAMTVEYDDPEKWKTVVGLIEDTLYAVTD